MSISRPPGFTYVTPNLLSFIRRETRKFLLHQYTRTKRLPTLQQDDWGEASFNFGSPVAGIPCFYQVNEVAIARPDGLTTLNRPELTLGFDDPIQIGDLVSNIVTQDGLMLVVGPLLVESLQPGDPNQGGPV